MLELEFGDTRIQISEDEWCKMYLVQGAEQAYLGAEDRNKVLSRLKVAFRDPESLKDSSIIEGHELFWFLTLSEAHTFFYLSNFSTDDAYCLHLFNGHTGKFTRIVLPRSVLSDWSSKIGELLI